MVAKRGGVYRMYSHLSIGLPILKISFKLNISIYNSSNVLKRFLCWVFSMPSHSSNLSSTATILSSNLFFSFSPSFSCIYKRNPSHTSNEFFGKSILPIKSRTVRFFYHLYQYYGYRTIGFFHPLHCFYRHILSPNVFSTTSSITSLHNAPFLFSVYQFLELHLSYQITQNGQETWLLTINFHQYFFAFSFDLTKTLPGKSWSDK